jgi:dipeptidyl aminopeptidase/acylaminoacyl peptidase
MSTNQIMNVTLWLTIATLLAPAIGTVGAEGGSLEAVSSLPSGPDFKEVLDLPRVSEPRISPDGRTIAYTLTTTDWEDNRYDTEIWLARSGEEPFQLTRTGDGDSNHQRWSPDQRWLAFLADRGDDTQIWLIRPAGGEAMALTAVKDGVSGFEWSPDGKSMAVAITEQKDERREKIEKSYGTFTVEDEEYRMTHLWLLDIEAAVEKDGGIELPEDDGKDDDSEGDDEDKDDDTDESPESEEQPDDDDQPSPFRRLTSGTTFTVDTFRWSPDGKRIAFSHRPDPRVESYTRADISIVDVASAEVHPLIECIGPDSNPFWSPDGEWILFSTKNERSEFWLNSMLAKVPATGGEPVLLTADFDGNPSARGWLTGGIFFTALDRTRRLLYRLDPDGGSPEPVTGLPRFIWGVDFAQDGDTLAVLGEDPDTLTEIYRYSLATAEAERITQLSDRTAGWAVGSSEVIRWQSRDDTLIEGVLIKPDDFDATKKYPLLVIIHGGPSWVSFPTRVQTYVYPVLQWLAKGAVILMPNYRGSAGYGQEFSKLNVRNLGVGDAWDVLSGVDYLIEQGFIDSERMGAMGWSQGGYISAFLTTTSNRFKAISVGAGISNWMTYYVNTDIHPFTRHYLEATPWDDPEIYAKTSPMTYIKQAETPTLIQHGELDRRVPVPNAYELFQGLQDVGVTTRLIIYKGFGHGIMKPKERLAGVWHNWQWFARYIWDEEVVIPAD